jgi:cyclopropane-fatty-acyl-phospholipid synthase
VTAVSNSKPQREFIISRCKALHLNNVEVITADVNEYEAGQKFDRILSVEMFEHMRNHELLLSRIENWLAPGGKLFVHHFSHRKSAYPYVVRDESDWMAKYFFSGGMMPSDDMLLHYQRDLVVEAKWSISGTHYQKTCDAWLARQDRYHDVLLPIFSNVYGAQEAKKWNQRWRLFFLACSELFGYRHGNEWWITHVRMTLRDEPN